MERKRELEGRKDKEGETARARSEKKERGDRVIFQRLFYVALLHGFSLLTLKLIQKFLQYIRYIVR